MYLNSSRERILKYILLVVGFVSVSVSLYLSHGIYFSNWSTAFSQRTFKLYHFVLLIGYLFLTFFTGLNKSFFRRKIFGETVVVLYYVSALITGLILLLFWFHQLLDSKRLILAYFVAFFIGASIIERKNSCEYAPSLNKEKPSKGIKYCLSFILVFYLL